MLEALTQRLQGVFGKLSAKGTVREEDLDEAMREVRIALLEADGLVVVAANEAARERYGEHLESAVVVS